MPSFENQIQNTDFFLEKSILRMFFFSIQSQREFWFLATVAFGLLSWGNLISSDYRQFDFTDNI